MYLGGLCCNCSWEFAFAFVGGHGNGAWSPLGSCSLLKGGTIRFLLMRVLYGKCIALVERSSLFCFRGVEWELELSVHF